MTEHRTTKTSPFEGVMSFVFPFGQQVQGLTFVDSDNLIIVLNNEIYHAWVDPQHPNHFMMEKLCEFRSRFNG